MKGTHKHTDASLICFNNHRCLSQSEESKFMYVYSLLIEKDICDSLNVSVKLPCVYMCLSSKDLFIYFFSIRVSTYFSYFCVNHTYPFQWSLYIGTTIDRCLHHSSSPKIADVYSWKMSSYARMDLH